MATAHLRHYRNTEYVNSTSCFNAKSNLLAYCLLTNDDRSKTDFTTCSHTVELTSQELVTPYVEPNHRDTLLWLILTSWICQGASEGRGAIVPGKHKKEWNQALIAVTRKVKKKTVLTIAMMKWNPFSILL